uniref:SH3 domain-binding protein 5-like n=1 Tax=Macrostomum lignano TaxID=282301 RepID=A0A1I8JK45_9PLAT
MAESGAAAAAATTTTDLSADTNAANNDEDPEFEPEFPEDAEVDPRVEDELEKMNMVALQLNEVETTLQQARNHFRSLLAETATKLEAVQSGIGVACVEKARPFYEAKRQCRLLQMETQSAALRYERSCEMLGAAKDLVRTAEASCPATGRGGQVDETWAMMLNQATEKVAKAEDERRHHAAEHARLTEMFAGAQTRVRLMESSLRSAIKKSRPYFEANARYQQALIEQKQHVEVYEEKVRICKRLYDEALRTLETISESIHTRRREENNVKKQKLKLGKQQQSTDEDSALQALGERGQGVGAEDPPESPSKLESFSAAKPPLPPSSSSSANSASSSSASASAATAAPVAKPRRRKSLRNSVATPIMSLLEDAMRYEQQHRLNHQLKSGTAASLSLPRSPSNHSTASSLDDEVLASFVVNPSASTAGTPTSTRSQSPLPQQQQKQHTHQRTLVLAPELRKFLHSLNASEQQQQEQQQRTD